MAGSSGGAQQCTRSGFGGCWDASFGFLRGGLRVFSLHEGENQRLIPADLPESWRSSSLVFFAGDKIGVYLRSAISQYLSFLTGQ